MVEGIRPSRIVLAFGPGAIMDLPDQQSVVVMGTDFWSRIEEITEPRLARRLGVDFFGSPMDSANPLDRRGVGVASFPLLRYCPRCFGLTPRPDCPEPDCRKQRQSTRPVRVVAACEAGHLEDFPWKRWVECNCPPERQDLLLESSESEPVDGSDLVVRCSSCKRRRTLQGALADLKARGEYIECSGQRPWLGVDVDCSHHLRGVMRGASNVYFPVITSSLSVPPFSRRLHRRLAETHHIEAAKENWEAGKIEAYINASAALGKWIEQGFCSLEDLKRAFKDIYTQSEETSIKAEEWETLSHDSSRQPGDDFVAVRVDINDSPLRTWFSRISRVEALREVVALRGFTRLLPASDWDDPRIQPLRLTDEELDILVAGNPTTPFPKRENRNWLPGFELRGEGLFFQFKEDLVVSWEGADRVRKRYQAIFTNARLPKSRDCVDSGKPRTILIHTFAHHMIREISLSCGYTMASLRERLFAGDGAKGRMAGCLIYTSTPDSEGSLGGLVAQAKTKERIWEHVRIAIEATQACIRGPLCTFADPATNHSLEGASCYACSHLPETSCEGLDNTLLDRRCIHDDRGEIGFFDQR